MHTVTEAETLSSRAHRATAALLRQRVLCPSLADEVVALATELDEAGETLAPYRARVELVVSDLESLAMGARS